MSHHASMPGSPRRLKARRGSLVVTAFIFVVAMSLMAFGIHQMLKTQMAQSSELKSVSLAKLQVLYLAEMGVNYWMFTANQNPAAAFPTATTIGTQDFKSKVAMVRSDPAGVARCLAGSTPAADVTAGFPPYMVTATLTTPDGTFTRAVYFDAARLSGGQYVLSGYRAQK